MNKYKQERKEAKMRENELKEAMNKLLPPKTEAGLTKLLQLDTWREKNGCDRPFCPFVLLLLEVVAETEKNEKKSLVEGESSKEASK